MRKSSAMDEAAVQVFCSCSIFLVFPLPWFLVVKWR